MQLKSEHRFERELIAAYPIGVNRVMMVEKVKKDLAEYIVKRTSIEETGDHSSITLRAQLTVLHNSQVEIIKGMLDIINFASGNQFKEITSEIMNEILNK